MIWLEYLPNLILYTLKHDLFCSPDLRYYGIRIKYEELRCLSSVSKVITYSLK